MTVRVLLEQMPSDWSAYAPDLDEVLIVTGTTRAEVIDRFRMALRALAKLKHDDGQTFPEVTHLQIIETVSA